MSEIVPAEPSDVDLIFDLYDKAIEFQKTVFDKQWMGFDAALVDLEIAAGRLWKVLDGGDVGCIFSVAYEDPIIWGTASHISAMYIHRIVTNPDFRGRGYVRAIVKWARDHAASRGLRFIRMDTWADNLKLKDYYIGHGFEWKGTVSPADSPTLPSHYRGIELGLFEMDMEKEAAQPGAASD